MARRAPPRNPSLVNSQIVPFNRPFLFGTELEYVREAMRGGHLSGDGPFTKRCREALEARHPGTRALLTQSCTAALEMAALLLDLEPDDEVILPSFTFVSSANAFLLRRARPVFVDVREDTLNLDERLLEAAVTPRTRAICVVHYAGVACEMDSIMDIAARRGAKVVEDAAHAIGAAYKGRMLGSIAPMGTFSFHETKNLTCGEGGALMLSDPALYHRAEILREKGTNRSAFFRGEVDKYTWVDVGSSFLPSDVTAAFLYAQLERAAEIDAKRVRVWNDYAAGLRDLATRGDVRLPTVPEHCKHTGHLFYLLCENLDVRTRLLAHLKANGVHAVFHYVPLHLSPVGRKFGGREGMLPVTESITDRLVRLPLHYGLRPDEQDKVVRVVRDFFGAA